MGEVSETVEPRGYLKFERRSTREGVDPFDQFEWGWREHTRRDFKTGEVKGRRTVELPTRWGDDKALPILAGKYIKTADLNLPGGSETSAKQVIGRVVDAYTEVAVEQGYFPSMEE